MGHKFFGNPVFRPFLDVLLNYRVSQKITSFRKITKISLVGRSANFFSGKQIIDQTIFPGIANFVTGFDISKCCFFRAPPDFETWSKKH